MKKYELHNKWVKNVSRVNCMIVAIPTCALVLVHEAVLEIIVAQKLVHLLKRRKIIIINTITSCLKKRRDRADVGYHVAMLCLLKRRPMMSSTF